MHGDVQQSGRLSERSERSPVVQQLIAEPAQYAAIAEAGMTAAMARMRAA